MELWRQLLLNGSVKLFWSNGILDKLISDISGEGFDIYTLDCSEWDINNYHNDLRSTLDFPDFYGKNLDAFNDCLSNMVPKEKGIVLVFRNYDLFAKKAPQDAYHILNSVQINSWKFLLEETLNYLPLFNQMMQQSSFKI
ncbi:barstar family protein [Bacillus sp. ISL-39]|uniref:barstar family protein n=1 Tax=Bacillus sp. ISL-39 TaxID=2819124 RepID=UPI001BE8D717|nr:barstar family protein [Bacillus sp. ISL-39]MBT2640364.1 barstar family protein [Bacillus sp. ISL-39]